MTANDIRKVSFEVQEKALKTKSEGAHTAAMLSAMGMLLGEIAAQLAEMNVHLARRPNPVTDTLPVNGQKGTR